MKEKSIIGRNEFVSFPEFGLVNIKAKVDTGANTSALHCQNINEDEENNILHFQLLDPKHKLYTNKVISISKYSSTTIKSSFGKKQKRYKINILMTLGKKNYKTAFTLTDRSKMNFPVLLGRKVLSGRFLVDVKKEYVLTD